MSSHLVYHPCRPQTDKQPCSQPFASLLLCNTSSHTKPLFFTHTPNFPNIYPCSLSFSILLLSSIDLYFCCLELCLSEYANVPMRLSFLFIHAYDLPFSLHSRSLLSFSDTESFQVLVLDFATLGMVSLSSRHTTLSPSVPFPSFLSLPIHLLLPLLPWWALSMMTRVPSFIPHSSSYFQVLRCISPIVTQSCTIENERVSNSFYLFFSLSLPLSSSFHTTPVLFLPFKNGFLSARGSVPVCLSVVSPLLLLFFSIYFQLAHVSP